MASLSAFGVHGMAPVGAEPPLGVEQAAFLQDTLPPEAVYESREMLVQSVNLWAAARGYAFITKRSSRIGTPRRVTATIMCDRAGAALPSDPERVRLRRTTSKKTGCQCSMTAKQVDEHTWLLKHRPDPKFAVHNHAPSLHPSAHPVHRALNAAEKTMIAGMVSAGIAPRKIKTFLSQTYGSMVSQQDIYNYAAKLRREGNKVRQDALENGIGYQEGRGSRLPDVLFGEPAACNCPEPLADDGFLWQ